MSLLPSLVVFFAVLLFAAASGQQSRDTGLLASQQADREMAWRRAETALAEMFWPFTLPDWQAQPRARLS